MGRERREVEERWKRGGREEKGREERRERARGEKRQEVRRRNLVRDLSKGDTEKGRPNKQHIIFFSFSFTLVFPRFFFKKQQKQTHLEITTTVGKVEARSIDSPSNNVVNL